MSRRNYKHWMTAARTDGPTVEKARVVMRMMIDDEDVDEDDDEDVDEDDDDHLHDQKNGHDC